MKVKIQEAKDGKCTIVDENGEKLVPKTFGHKRAAERYIERVNRNKPVMEHDAEE